LERHSVPSQKQALYQQFISGEKGANSGSSNNRNKDLPPPSSDEYNERPASSSSKQMKMDISSTISPGAQAVPLVDDFKKEIQESLLKDEFTEKLRLRNELNEQSLLTKDSFFNDGAFLPSFPGKPTYLYGTIPPEMLLGPEADKIKRVIASVDITRITNRLILCGLFWKEKSDKFSKRNNIVDGSQFLNTRFKDKYIVWNLAGNLTLFYAQ
jgi:hypothetical protein